MTDTDDQHQHRHVDAEGEHREFLDVLDALFHDGFLSFPALHQDYATNPGPTHTSPPGQLDALVYVKPWESGVLDVVIVYTSTDAFAYRVTGARPGVPAHRSPHTTAWQHNAPLAAVVAGILELPPPDFPAIPPPRATDWFTLPRELAIR
jgi:hypothetical protein